MRMNYENRNILADIDKGPMVVVAGTCDMSFGAGLIRALNKQYRISDKLTDPKIGFEKVPCANVGVLFVKENYTDEANYFDVVKALMFLREYVVDNAITAINMPKICSAHEGLNWAIIEEAIFVIFDGVPVDITVCIL